MIAGWGCWRIDRAPRHGFLGMLAIIFGGILIASSVVWFCIAFAESAAGFVGISGVSAPRYGGAENVKIVPIVVPELEFRDVQRQIFAADLVERAHDTALQQRPKAVDCLGVDNAVHIAAGRVPHEFVGGTSLSGECSRCIGGSVLTISIVPVAPSSMVVLEPQMRAAASSRFPVFQLVIEIGVFGRDLRLGHGLDLFRGEVLDPQRPPVAALEPLVSSIDATTRRSRPLRVMVIGSDKALSSSVSKFLRNSAEEIRISVLRRIGHDNRIFREPL